MCSITTYSPNTHVTYFFLLGASGSFSLSSLTSQCSYNGELKSGHTSSLNDTPIAALRRQKQNQKHLGIKAELHKEGKRDRA